MTLAIVTLILYAVALIWYLVDPPFTSKTNDKFYRVVEAAQLVFRIGWAVAIVAFGAAVAPLAWATLGFFALVLVWGAVCYKNPPVEYKFHTPMYVAFSIGTAVALVVLSIVSL